MAGGANLEGHSCQQANHYQVMVTKRELSAHPNRVHSGHREDTFRETLEPQPISMIEIGQPTCHSTLDIPTYSMHINKILLSLLIAVFVCASSAIAADTPQEVMFKQLTALAETGNADVKYNLGMFHNNGIGTPRDHKAAFRNFTDAAEAGNLLAAYKVGCYYAGQFTGVVPMDEQSAFKYKLRAAEGGYDLAQHDVAIYLAKKGDFVTSVMWWEKASRQGYVPSTAYLANYLSGAESKDKVTGLALMLVLRKQLPETPKELANRLAAAQAALSEEENLQAERIQASWLTGPTPLTTAAHTAVSTLPALLSSLKR